MNFSFDFLKSFTEPIKKGLQQSSWVNYVPSEQLKSLSQKVGSQKMSPITEKVFDTVAPGVSAFARGGVEEYKKSFVESATKMKKSIEEDPTLFALGVMGGGLEDAASKQAKKVVSDYLSSKVSSVIEKEPIFKNLAEKTYSTFSKIYTSLVDRFNPVVQISKKAEAISGTKLKPGEDPTLLIRRFLGNKGIAENKLFVNTTKLLEDGSEQITGPGLAKILKPVDDKIDDVVTLWTAQRDLELSGRGIYGATPKESEAVINALKTKLGSEFDQVQKTVQDLVDFSRRAKLEPLKDIGAISEDFYNNAINVGEHYAPSYRIMDELEKSGYLPQKIEWLTEKQKSVPIKAIEGSKEKIINPLESLVKDVYRTTAFVEKERVARSIANLRNVNPEVEELIKPVEKLGKNTITTFENGVRKYFEVDPELAKAIDQMSSSDANIITKIMSYPTKLLRTGATVTPEFIGRNPLRDQFSAFVYSKYGYTPGVDFLKGLWEVIGKKDTYNKWMASGGAQSMFISMDRMSAQKELQNVLGKKITSYSPLEALRVLSEFGEKSTRVGAFKNALKKGATEAEAMLESREITLDFGRIGREGKVVNQIIAFWNANVQGLDRLARAMKEKPIQTSFKAVSGITVPTISLYLINRDNPRYQELPQWRKDLFWNIFPTGDKPGPIVSIPKPYEIGMIFGSVPEHILNWIDKNDSEALSSIPSTLLRASTPGVLPTVFGPILENQANYSFFRDRPIVSQSVQDLPPEMQANTYTSETAKEIGKIIKKSPAKVENIITGYLAGLGNYALDTSDFILKSLGITNPPEPPTIGLEKIPFIKAFIAKEPIGTNSESVNRFYNALTQSTASYNAAREIAKKGDIDGSSKYMEEHKEALFYKGLNNLATNFSKMRQHKELIYNDRTLTPDQKKQSINEIDTLMTEMAKQALIILNENK